MGAKLVDVEETTLFNAEITAGSTVGSIHQHDIMQHWSVWSSISDATPSAQSFTTAEITTTGDYIRKTAHGMYTGLPGYLTGTGAALPTGLATATHYWIIRRDADTFQLATSKANALAGTAVTLAQDNTVSAFHPDALGGLSASFLASLDGTNYWPLPGLTITAAGATGTSAANIAYNYLKMDVTTTGGQVTITAKARSIGGD